MNIEKNFDLTSYNTFKIDAKANYFFQFSTLQELQLFFSDPQFIHIPKLVIGGGSNILFTKDFNGVVLLNKIKGIEILKEENDFVWIKAGAGEVWHNFVLSAIDKGLCGVENLALIPGTVGAAPIQNIGAYGMEIKDIFDSLEAFDIENKTIHNFHYGDCCFGYRDSVFKQECKGKYIITSVTFKLSKKPNFNISYGALKDTLEEMGVKELSAKAICEAVMKIRRSKLPDPAVIGNAGSFFKNPEIPLEHFIKLKSTFPTIPSFPSIPGFVKVPAGWLNEQCGWKGKTIGNIGVHKDQALVLVNYGGAKGEEVKKLSEEIKFSVLQKFGIQLETEVNII